MRSRVVVTGLGIVSPIGIGVSDFSKAALASQSGISAITLFDPFPIDGYRSKVAGEGAGTIILESAAQAKKPAKPSKPKGKKKY